MVADHGVPFPRVEARRPGAWYSVALRSHATPVGPQAHLHRRLAVARASHCLRRRRRCDEGSPGWRRCESCDRIAPRVLEASCVRNDLPTAMRPSIADTQSRISPGVSSAMHRDGIGWQDERRAEASNGRETRLFVDCLTSSAAASDNIPPDRSMWNDLRAMPIGDRGGTLELLVLWPAVPVAARDHRLPRLVRGELGELATPAALGTRLRRLSLTHLPRRIAAILERERREDA